MFSSTPNPYDELINKSLEVHNGVDPRIMGVVSVLRPAFSAMFQQGADRNDKIFSYEDIWSMVKGASEYFIAHPEEPEGH